MRWIHSKEEPVGPLILIVSLLTVAMLITGCGGGEGGADSGTKTEGETEVSADLTWPTIYRDNRRTGRAEASGPEAPEVMWTYDAGSQTRSFSVLDKEGNVVAGFEGKAISLDPESGSVNWEFSTGEETVTTPCVDEDGTIYISAGNLVHALSSGGEEEWSYDVGSSADEPFLGPDGTVYAGSIGGKLVALSKDGDLEWYFQADGCIRSPSTDDEGNLYCSGATLKMYALDKDGKPKWEFKPEGDLPLYDNLYDWANTLDVPSVGDDGTIYAGTYVSPPMTTTGQQITDYAVPQQGKCYAISPDGQKKWEYVPPFEMSWTVHTPSIGTDGTLYAGTSCWRVVALDPDGNEKWVFNTGEGHDVCPSIYSPSIGKDGLLYSATTSAKIFCITPDGNEKWRYAAEQPWLPGPGGEAMMGGSNNFTPPPIAEDGSLFSVLAEGKVYAFKPPSAQGPGGDVDDQTENRGRPEPRPPRR